jgi:uncharacterized protein YraI
MKVDENNKMNKISFVPKLSAIIFIVLLLGATLSLQAGGEGKYTMLNFPDAEPGHCTGWYVSANPYDASTFPAFWSPAIVQFTVTDGTGRVISQGTQDLKNNFGPLDNGSRVTLQSFGLPNVDWTGARNPIHAVVTVDGDLIADLTANNPCLTGISSNRPASSSSSGSSTESATLVPVMVPADACSLHTFSKHLNARIGAGTSFAVVGTLTPNQEYSILKQGKDRSGVIWLQIDLPGIESAWAISNYVTISTDCSGVTSTQEAATTASSTEVSPSQNAPQEALAASTNEQTPAATSTCTVTAQSNGVRQRSGPGTTFAIVGLMENGNEYSVLGMGTDNHSTVWWLINAGDAGNAWVISSSTRTHGDCTGVAQATPEN